MGSGWKLLLVEVLVVLTAVAETLPAAASENTIRPGCRDKCGNISIPYPFGVGERCFREGFQLGCNDTVNPPKLFVDTKTIEVAQIFLSGQLRVKVPMGVDCYDRSGVRTTAGPQYINLNARPFTFSDTKNKFTAVGCDTVALIQGTMGVEYVGGCVSYCASLQGMDNDTCSGIGCCQNTIPRGLKNFQSVLSSTFNHTRCWDFNPCGYAFMAEEEQYSFSTTDLNDTGFQRPFPIMLDWSIGNLTCRQVRSNGTADYACRSEHSECVDSPKGIGYVCKCSTGYEGNPYLERGCEDIDECAVGSDKNLYPCRGVCANTPGSYNCTCPPGTSSADPKQDQCVPNPEGSSPAISLPMKLGLGFGIGFLVLLTASSWAYWGFQNRRLLHLKQKFFEQNGGLFLQQNISSHQGSTAFRIFTEGELAKATSNFDDARILGRGGHGIVYKGTLDNGREVAIKKSRTVDERQSKEFAKEMLILSQINHRNIVKLLGCCLEVEVPMLVYEFVSNGTLFDYIHDNKHLHTTSLETRLRIAAEAAEALAYLHSFASTRILHGDVKSSNILLDDSYMAKVSDFGASILAPLDQEQFATVLQGTCGYLDPEYLLTCQLTDKSDVYSFGVVLVELLTGKKALHFEGSGEDQKSLAMTFVSAVAENRVMQILEAQLVDGGEMALLQEVADLANRCLSLKGEEWPTMKEVAMVLQGLRGSGKHPWVMPHNPEEVESLLGEASGFRSRDGTEYLSLKTRAMLNIEGGR